MKINNPYFLSKEDALTIRKNFAVHTDWEKAAFEHIKKKIIDHLRQEQNNKCCYCQAELGFDLKTVDIEHIIPKSKFEKFTFHPKNLALACPGCNTSKGKKSVTLKDIVRYPSSGRNITIIHPHFDHYYNHVQIHADAIYQGLDDKGCETIKICKLYRLKNVLRRQRERIVKKSPLHELVEALRASTLEEQAELAGELIKIIKLNNG